MTEAPPSIPPNPLALARTPIPDLSPIEGEGSLELDLRLRRDTPAPIALGLSGGGDSLALLRLAGAWARRANRPLLALCVDHGLNPDGAAWARFAAARAAESGAAFRRLAWEGDKPTSGLPAAARAARHALLARAAREDGASVVLLGHTADDVAEADRMRASDAPAIGRLRPWSPSPAWPEGRGVMLLRPMLALRRAALRDWLAARGETWIDDPANTDPRFARARARAGESRAAAPASPVPEAAVAVLAALCELLADGGLALPLAALLEAPEGAALHVLSVAVLCAGGGTTPPRRASVQALLDRLGEADPPATTLTMTLAGARIALRRGCVRFTREAGDAARNPRPDRDGVVDGRFLAETEPGRFLTHARFRAACFLVGREGDLAAQAASRPLPALPPLA